MDTNAKPHWPKLFVEIIEKDRELATYRALRVVLTRAAEEVLKWNHNKGNKV